MKVVVTGPECCGKSSLAAELAEHYGVAYLQEPARFYLKAGYVYQPSDLLAIFRKQLELEIAHNHEPLILDTDLQTLCIWWQEKFGPLPESLRSHYARQCAVVDRLYLLCRPDLPWEFDALRENPNDRERIFALYHSDLTTRKLPFLEIGGDGRERFEAAWLNLNRYPNLPNFEGPLI